VPVSRERHALDDIVFFARHPKLPE
jgi:hypothetical protein